MMDKDVAGWLGVDPHELKRWRHKMLKAGVDYDPPVKGSLGVRWKHSGVKAAMRHYGEPEPVLLKIYQFCPNRRMVRVVEVNERERKGLLVLPPRQRGRYSERGGKVLLYGHRTPDPEVYVWAGR